MKALIVLTGLFVLAVGAATAATPKKWPAPPQVPEQTELPKAPPRVPTGPARPDEAYGSVTGPGFYKRCLQLVNIDADRAYDEAVLWRDQGGGGPAEHCAAMALARMGRLEEAAQRLTRVAASQAQVDADLRAEIFEQSGLLWLMAGKPQPAHEAFSQALSTAPPDDPARAQYFFDRAQAAANLGRWRDTANDLTQSLALGKGHVEAFVLRARAHRALGDLVSARNDVNAALNLDPDSAEALLERGNVRHARGDAKGARADWLRVKTVAKASELQQAAQSSLAELDAELLKDCKPGSGSADTGDGVHLQIDNCAR